jgi:hypothetical protein
MSKRQVGAYAYNELIRQGRHAVKLLRDDIEELRINNQSNAEVLNFLLIMSGRLDEMSATLEGLKEIGVANKLARAGDNNNAE